MKLIKNALLLLLATSMVACGQGGGSTPPVEPTSIYGTYLAPCQILEDYTGYWKSKQVRMTLVEGTYKEETLFFPNLVCNQNSDFGVDLSKTYLMSIDESEGMYYLLINNQLYFGTLTSTTLVLTKDQGSSVSYKKVQ